MYKVLFLIQNKGTTVGAEILDIQTNEVTVIYKNVFLYYKGKFVNAIVTSTGILRGNKITLPVKEETVYAPINISKKTKEIQKISKYIIMYEDKKVLQYDKTTDKVTILEPNYLPYTLRNTHPLYGSHVVDWLVDRLNNLNRTYMNMVYIARKVGRDRDKIILDSAAISITDNFWVKTTDIATTWKHLKSLRDQNNELTQTALTGSLISGSDKGVTSLFTIKGYFPKGIFGGYIYKLKKDAILEYPAYLIASQIGVKVAKCELSGDTVRIKVFTTDKLSLVHASELKKHYQEYLLYNALAKIKRYDLMREMQRMYIFNYLIGNPDLHEDNYGVLYNSETFELLEMAPCYDHNIAFDVSFNGLTREKVDYSEQIELDELTKQFIGNNKDIAEKLQKLNLSEISKYLSNAQINGLLERINNILFWAGLK